MAKAGDLKQVYVPSKVCQALGFLLGGVEPKTYQVVFPFGRDILTSPKGTDSVTSGSDIKVVWSSLHSLRSDIVNN